MAGGIDWFRWHHGSVTDPKFQLVAKKAGVRLGDVIAVWAFVLEKASADTERGTIGTIDFETLDFLLGTDEGAATRILDAMTARGLIVGSRIARWEDRQPKRERDDDHSTDRVKAFRERQRQLAAAIDGETPRNATETQETPREEKSREEKRNTPQPPKGGEDLPGFAAFWAAWPVSDRKQAKGKCLEAWKKVKAEADAALIVAHLERMKASQSWTKDGGQFIPAPLVYLHRRSWEGAESFTAADWWTPAGFSNAYEANNEGCREHNAHLFRDGRRLEAA